MAVTRRGVIAADRLTMGFAAGFAVVVLVRAGDSPSWPWHLVAAALIALLAWMMKDAPADSPLMDFLGPVYPVLIAPALFAAIGTLNQDGGRNHDLLVQHLDVALFGGPISVTWHQSWPSLALSAILHVCYVTYYVIVATVLLWHWRKAGRAAYERACFLVALAFFTCYLVFVMFPVDGPRYFFGAATGPAAEIGPARMVHALLAGGSSHGTAFPSSHICVCWCAVLASWRANRTLALAFALPALGLALGTVYGQFHYAIDALAGAALAWGLLFATDPLIRLLAPKPVASGPGRRATEAFKLR